LAGDIRKVWGDHVKGLSNDDLVRVVPIMKHEWWAVLDVLIAIRRGQIMKIPEWRDVIRLVRCMPNEDEAMIELRHRIDAEFEFAVAMDQYKGTKRQEARWSATKLLWFNIHGEKEVVSEEERDRLLASGWTVQTLLPNGLMVIIPPGQESLVAHQLSEKTASGSV